MTQSMQLYFKKYFQVEYHQIPMRVVLRAYWDVMSLGTTKDSSQFILERFEGSISALTINPFIVVNMD